MKQEQVEALKKSIEHWEENLRNPLHAQIGWRHCACCQKWIRKSCEGCPIYEHTGVTYCQDTPYPGIEYRLNAISKTHPVPDDMLLNLTNAIAKELEFLRQLLAKVEAQEDEE